MKIYTKKGDEGQTTLVGGSKISKDSAIVEAYGTVDELIANIGFIEGLRLDRYYKDLCFQIQDKLMLCAANIADTRQHKKLPDITEEDVKYLESQIDLMDKDLEPLTNFVLFRGAYPTQFNILRTLCRRAERLTIKVFYTNKATANNNVAMVIKYLNRLSDLFFTMARHTCFKHREENNAKEIVWKI
jgi:cob(I)alamin adenosyltransferase